MAKVDEKEGGSGLSPGTLIDGRYKVVRFIGQGGNGHVHEVEHVLTGRRLAVKSLHDETSYGRLEQEARATSLMKNGHAVKITDMGATPSAGPYIVMELLEGQSLRSLLDDTGQLPLELTVNIALQVCECLAEAHQHGIIHRDLKPDNVYLCQGTAAGEYDVKVLDFGVVKIEKDGPIPNNSLTRTGSTVGTPFYMSLEQLRNSSAVDLRADIYALGVVVYECLSGKKPYQAETIGDLVYALCSGPPTHLSRLRPDLPVDVCDVVMRALSSAREDRPPGMVELATALLPYGDPAFGLWLRTGAEARKQKARPSQDPPPGVGTPTPSGVKHGLVPGVEVAPPPIPRPDASGSPRPGPPRPDGPRPGAAAPAGPPPRQVIEDEPSVSTATVQRPAPPELDRETPTEMYIKGVHTPLGGVQAMGAERPSNPHMREDRDTPTRAMEAVKATHAGGLPHVAPHKMTLPLVAGPVPSPHGGPDTGAPFGSRPPAPSHPVIQPSPALSPSPSSGIGPMPSFRPAWQGKLDRALVGVGGWLENSGQDAARHFRAASPRAQIAIVALAASVLAALSVLLIWLFVG